MLLLWHSRHCRYLDSCPRCTCRPLSYNMTQEIFRLPFLQSSCTIRTFPSRKGLLHHSTSTIKNGHWPTWNNLFLSSQLNNGTYQQWLQGHPMELFLKISVLQTNFCGLGDVEEIICSWVDTLNSAKLIFGRKVLLGNRHPRESELARRDDEEGICNWCPE